MRSTRMRLAMLAATAVVLALLAAGIAFNLFAGHKIEADAVGDIKYALYLDQDASTTGRSPNYLTLDSSYRIDKSEPWWGTEVEEQLAAWFAAHPEEGVVRRLTIAGWTCYATMVSTEDYVDNYADYDEGTWGREGYYIAYVDITSELSLIATVNTAFAVIGLVGALLAATAGHVSGRHIDTAHEAQKRFYENMSHDLKTPLAAIRGYAEGAHEGVVDTDEATRAIVRETDRMTQTINEILGLSRLEAGAITPAKEVIDVGDFVQDCLMPLEGTIRAKGIRVELDLAPGEVMADPNLFDHALSNVLANAVRHAATCLRVRFDGLSLAVWNDGTAPSAAQMEHLFDRYHAGEGGSTGIGLAIAREVAELHGWSLSAHVLDNGLELVFSF